MPSAAVDGPGRPPGWAWHGERMPSRPWLLRSYAAVAVADTALAATGRRSLRRVTKPALMPLLAAYVATADPPEADTARRWTIAGLLLSGVGDVALLGDGDEAFAVGLGSFLAAHGCYLAALTNTAEAGYLRRRPWLAAPYGVGAAALLAVLLPRAGRMRVPVAVYSAALAAMALLAVDTGRPALAGGGTAFLVSDALLAVDRFTTADIPAADGLVMATYTLAQALIAAGMAAG
jgi:uncharacterized membrane protein YhhN